MSSQGASVTLRGNPGAVRDRTVISCSLNPYHQIIIYLGAKEKEAVGGLLSPLPLWVVARGFPGDCDVTSSLRRRPLL